LDRLSRLKRNVSEAKIWHSWTFALRDTDNDEYLIPTKLTTHTTTLYPIEALARYCVSGSVHSRAVWFESYLPSRHWKDGSQSGRPKLQARLLLCCRPTNIYSSSTHVRRLEEAYLRKTTRGSLQHQLGWPVAASPVQYYTFADDPFVGTSSDVMPVGRTTTRASYRHA
jgi:hypothetical protein